MTNQNNENNEITYQNALEQYSKEIMNTPTKPAPAPAEREEAESVLAHYADKYFDSLVREAPEDAEYWAKLRQTSAKAHLAQWRKLNRSIQTRWRN